jgi:hypothetical protein
MRGAPETCYAAPSLATWRGAASAREDSRLDARAAALMPIVKGVSGSFGGIIEVRASRDVRVVCFIFLRASRAARTRGASSMGRVVRGTARGWEGLAGARKTRDANGARTRDGVERLTMTRASDVCACLFLRRRVVCNPWTW